ncbi:hypothetical protein TcYC6_0102240 [Trypanosoma cruzi]|uniref:Uncharacterized protein n=1 Tax=Trypanosoma cruzi TaxID=5693 RepID=A0A7J6Y861_TRYCR|nr:hypothetical protein ECC02_004203 [Trypanosoma cruzi]KAF8294279.1 hypothetical protein TcYC6_0102240 [Trypanosoma cruzi]
MARRQRVPRHKEHGRRRNKNPKLSPFQREQRRNKMANQPPVSLGKNGSQRDYPISQRAVMKFLMAKQKRLQERHQQRHEEQQKKEIGEHQQKQTKKTTVNGKLCEDNGEVSPSPATHSSMATAAVEAVVGKKKHHAKKAKKTSLTAPVALNEEMAASLARPIMAFKTLAEGERGEAENAVEAIISRKKERKHRKKAEARRERVREVLRETEEQLREEVLSSKGGKKRRREHPVDAKDAAFEKKLKQMQKEKAEVAVAAEKRVAGENIKQDRSETESQKRKRKRITFLDDGAKGGVDAPHSAMRYPNDKGAKVPRDFCELVDVVRFGERVEAPPVFDVIPRHDASIKRLANRMESSSRNFLKGGVASSQKERLQMLSSVGGVGEERRLERLGLGPVSTSAAAARRTGAPKKLSKEEEMRRLREAVMEAYRRKKRIGAEARKGVDMHHQFPIFS